MMLKMILEPPIEIMSATLLSVFVQKLASPVSVHEPIAMPLLSLIGPILSSHQAHSLRKHLRYVEFRVKHLSDCRFISDIK